MPEEDPLIFFDDRTRLSAEEEDAINVVLFEVGGEDEPGSPASVSKLAAPVAPTCLWTHLSEGSLPGSQDGEKGRNHMEGVAERHKRVFLEVCVASPEIGPSAAGFRLPLRKMIRVPCPGGGVLSCRAQHPRDDKRRGRSRCSHEARLRDGVRHFQRCA